MDVCGSKALPWASFSCLIVLLIVAFKFVDYKYTGVRKKENALTIVGAFFVVNNLLFQN